MFSLISSLLISAALAQDSVDSHNFSIAPNQQDLEDGLVTFRSVEHPKATITESAVFEYADNPLVLYTQDGDSDPKRTIIVDDISAVNLSIFYAPHPRVGLGISAPIIFDYDGQGSGDGGFSTARLSGQVGLTKGVSVVGFLDLPGLGNEFIKYDHFAGGFMAGATTPNFEDKVSISLNGGVYFGKQLDFYNLKGGTKFTGRALVSYLVTDDFAVRGEVVTTLPFEKNDVPLTESPTEAVVSVKGFASDKFGWTMGFSKALTIGSLGPTYRLLGGVDLALGTRSKHECKGCDDAVMQVESEGENTITLLSEDGTVTQLTDSSTVQLPSGSYSVLSVVSSQGPSKPPLVEIEDNEIILMSPIYFDFDKSTIKFPDSTEILNALVDVLMTHSEIQLVEVAGHTDERGSDKYNLSLSRRRVSAVVDYLVGHGIGEGRLLPVGYGESMLAYEDCKDEFCHQLNRRVKFMILDRTPTED